MYETCYVKLVGSYILHAQTTSTDTLLDLFVYIAYILNCCYSNITQYWDVLLSNSFRIIKENA